MAGNRVVEKLRAWAHNPSGYDLEANISYHWSVVIVKRIRKFSGRCSIKEAQNLNNLNNLTICLICLIVNND